MPPHPGNSTDPSFLFQANDAIHPSYSTMRFFASIDAGGTKTQASIACVSDSGVRTARGVGGPGNLTYGVEGAVNATRAAVLSGLSQLGVEVWPEWEGVWAGYAGCGRPSDVASLRPPLEGLFPAAEIRITSDGELLSAPRREGEGSCVSLVCGTGSIAQLWPQRLRSGGWGLLDDRGSATSLGKKALSSVLQHAANRDPAPEWHGLVLERWGVDHADQLVRAACTLDTGMGHAEADSKRTSRIAGTAPIVVQAAEEGDQEARRLLRLTAVEVCELLEPLRGRLEREDEAMLAIAGSLALDPTFWSVVEDEFARRGWSWSSIRRIEVPAQAGLEALLRAAGLETSLS